MITLTSGASTAVVLTYGARLRSWQAGNGINLTGPELNLGDYETALPFNGPIVAPVINRIADGRAVLEGRHLVFEPNQDGIHTLHSGTAGTHCKIWDMEDTGPDTVAFRVDLADGEGGFPGNRTIHTRYTLLPDRLCCTIKATTDATTLMNPAHHAVFNVEGTDTWEGQRLKVAAQHYLPTDGASIPTGQIAPVQGTEFDLRAPRDPGHGVDHNYCFEPSTGLAHRASLIGPRQRLEVWSDAPGLQVFTRFDTTIALEPQAWPDAPNHPAFPSIVLHSGRTFERRAEYRIIARG